MTRTPDQSPKFTRRSALAATSAMTLGVLGIGTPSASAAEAPGTAIQPPSRPSRDAARVLADPFSPTLVNPAPAGFAPKSPLVRAHAHNDYVHARPLWDALGQGFTSVEADVWYRDGKLLLGHTLLGTLSGRGVEDWYVKPLAAWVRAQRGRVFPGWKGQFTLLIDIKEKGAESLMALEAMLARYADVLWHVKDGREVPGPVRVIYSGNRPTSAITGNRVRFGSFDGHLDDLSGTTRPSTYPLFSESWNGWGWQGFGTMPSDQFTRLAQFVASAKESGARSRLWGQPMTFAAQRENVWQAQLDAGVSLINADHLEHLRAFLLARGVA